MVKQRKHTFIVYYVKPTELFKERLEPNFIHYVKVIRD